MASKSATAPKAPAKAAAAQKAPSGPSTASLSKELAELKASLSGIKEAIRRLASGQIVTEEHRDELFSLLDGK